MTQIWMYSLAASTDPDHVSCVVPWLVDQDLIFFGPCKKRIRELLRRRFLGESISHAPVTEDLFIVGVNGSNQTRSRKIVWAGKLSEIMTFAEADRRLLGDRFRRLRDHRLSPLHVRPLFKNGELSGYEHVSDEHLKGEEWVSDLVSHSAKANVQMEGKKLMLRQGTPWQAFDRDCCMMLKNLFFASGQGIEFDEEALEILRQAQRGKSGIDRYKIFGLTSSGQANGLRGTFLKIPDDLAKRFIAWLEDRSQKASKHQRSEKDGPTKACCT
jgi:hypothetical protein